MRDNQNNELNMGRYRPPNKYEYLNYEERPEGTIVDAIVLHYTVSNYTKAYTTLTAEQGVSAHFLIREDGRIDNLVPLGKLAWHAGLSNWRGQEEVNKFSIGIEIVNPGSGEQECFPIFGNSDIPKDRCEKHPFTKQQLENVVDIINLLKSYYPEIENRNIIGHSDITAYSGRKIDPGVAFDWKYLADKGHGLYPKVYVKDPTLLFQMNDSGVGVKTLQQNLNLYGYNITNSGHFDEHLANVVRAFKLHFNQEQEFGWGEWDSKSDAMLNDLLAQVNELQNFHYEL